MILWCDGPHEASENMRRDAGLLEAMERGAWPGGAEPAEPVLRLFGFVPPGITLGHSQRAEHELDLARCRADGVTWARRPTGGRAIFHSEEWTYSLAAPIGDPDWGGTLGESYARVSRLILASLVRLGVPAEMAGADGGRRPIPAAGSSERAAAPACFATAARHEILLHGRKLVGSAQRRTAGGLLQQGSVLLGPGHLRLADYLAVPEELRLRARAALATASADAGATLGGAAPLERWAESLLAELPARTRLVRTPPEGWRLTLDGSESAPYTPSVRN